MNFVKAYVVTKCIEKQILLSVLKPHKLLL